MAPSDTAEQSAGPKKPYKTVTGQYLDRVLYEKDKIIFKEGNEGVNAFVIESGKVGIFKTLDGKRTPLAVMKEGEIFGEMSAITGQARTATAIALESTTIVRISRNMINEKIQQADPFLRALLKILIKNLSQVNDRYAMAAHNSEAVVKSLKDELAALKSSEPVKEADSEADTSEEQGEAGADAPISLDEIMTESATEPAKDPK